MAIALKPKLKIQFFDRSIIKKKWKKINRDPLSRAGLLTRRIMRGSIKRRKQGGKSGPVGSPPKSRSPGAPFKLIFSVLDITKTTATIGMIGFSRGVGTPAPGLQDSGGTAVRKTFRQMGKVKTKKGRFKPIFGKPKKERVKIPARPFSQPALEKAQPRFPALWANSLNRG